MAENIDEWRQVQNELRQKLDEPRLALFHPLLERLEQMSTARPYTPSHFRVFMAFIDQMHALLPVSSVSQVLDAACKRTLTFQNPDWDVDTVNQAQVIFQTVIKEVRPEIKTQEPEPIHVPIVLVVMRGAEADQAVDKSAFENYPQSLKDNFQRLSDELKQKGLQDWRLWYADEIGDWHPHGRAQMICQVVRDALAELQQREHYQRRLIPDFYDICTVANDWPRLQDLRRGGCVVVVDSLSLRHPLILRAFQQSLLDAYHNVAVLAIAPISHGWELLREMTVILQVHLTEMEFYKRQKDLLDEGCEELTDIERFPKEFLLRVRRWLGSTGARPSTLPKF